MKCYLCAAAGRDEGAVGACPHCGAGLCVRHFEESLRGRPLPNHGRCDHAAQAAALWARRSSLESATATNGHRIEQRPMTVGARS